MFSYAEYKNIINLVKFHLPIVDFKDVSNSISKFCVIRHDIEFSIDRAVKLARIESNELGIKSTYTVQLRNNTYNALSEKNIKLIQEIKNLGHSIGLHQNPPDMSDDKLVDYISKDIETLEHYYNFEVDRFAFHRCGSNPKLLEAYVQVPKKINCYDRNFFHYFSGERPDSLNVHYLSDSNHQWKYGYPLELDFDKVKKIQLLMHPFSWTKEGYGNSGNFVSLVKERRTELLYDMETENKVFPKELLDD
tara:strand:+ start:198 stop:944 length:747 start_codon:yes stop_codon:yes gene_type:complete